MFDKELELRGWVRGRVVSLGGFDFVVRHVLEKESQGDEDRVIVSGVDDGG
jgi:hypothetical protein